MISLLDRNEIIPFPHWLVLSRTERFQKTRGRIRAKLERLLTSSLKRKPKRAKDVETNS